MLIESQYLTAMGTFASAGVEESDIDTIEAFFCQPDDRLCVSAVVVEGPTVTIIRSYQMSGIMAERNILLFETDEDAGQAGDRLHRLMG